MTEERRRPSMPGHYHKRCSKSGRRANRSRTGTALIVIVVAFFAVFSALPLILMISQAFKPAGELYLTKISESGV